MCLSAPNVVICLILDLILPCALSLGVWTCLPVLTDLH